MTEHTLDWALERGLHQYSDPRGVDLVERCEPLAEWVEEASALGLFQYLRHHESFPDVHGEVVAWGGQHHRGINLASQDYLGLARDAGLAAAAASATLRHGTHSAGSEPMGGGFGEARALESELADFVEHRHVVLFPTGWGAGYGAIKGLLRPYDHVLIDTLAHDCLRHGARASGAEVWFFAHNDMASLEKRLKKARLAYRRCLERGVILNCVEFPACRRGEARFRLQVSPRHNPQQLEATAAIIAEAIAWARQRPEPSPGVVGLSELGA